MVIQGWQGEEGLGSLLKDGLESFRFAPAVGVTRDWCEVIFSYYSGRGAQPTATPIFK